jgi:hypothetical protein
VISSEEQSFFGIIIGVCRVGVCGNGVCGILFIIVSHRHRNCGSDVVGSVHVGSDSFKIKNHRRKDSDFICY